MSSETMHPRGTSAHMPDPNWSHVRETVLMLELSAVQIEAAMTDSNTSVEVLTESFMTMAGQMRLISESVQTLPDDGEVGITRQKLTNVSEHLSGMVDQAIVAFQFYDKMAQRLAHVGIGLGELSDLVADGRRLHSPSEWVALQDKIRNNYSTREEIAMFEAVMQGMPMQKAGPKKRAEMNDKSDDIEFF